MSVADYGILLREQSVTNLVASPTKFAEYLALGLPVLISENLGDYSEFVQHHNCGSIVKEALQKIQLNKQTPADKQKLVELSRKYFYKNSAQNHLSYTAMLQAVDII